MSRKSLQFVESVGSGRRSRAIRGVAPGPDLFSPVPASFVAPAAVGPRGAGSRRRCLGLSRSHSLTQLYRGGERLTLPKQKRGSRVGGGRKGRSCGMSKHAKASAVKLFKSIDQTRILSTWFITNTLPRNFFCPIHEFKKVLERYFARLTRAYGDRLSWYWAIEPTAAGQWHLHMIAFWVKDAPTSRERWLKFREWNDRAWHQATKVPDEAHLRAGCKIEGARSWSGVTCYLSGYLSPQKWAHYDGPPTGRVHGIRNGAILPVHPESYSLSARAVELLRRAVARVRAHRASGVFWIKADENGSFVGAKRERVPFGPDSPGHTLRDRIKVLAQMGMGRQQTIRLKRVRARFYRNEVEWEDEFQVMRDGTEKHIGVKPARADEWGRAEPSYAFGPSELHMPWSQALRLIEWAIQEDRRRQEVERETPF